MLYLRNEEIYSSVREEEQETWVQKVASDINQRGFSLYKQRRLSKRDESDWLRHVVVIFIPATQPSKSTSRVSRRRRWNANGAALVNCRARNRCLLLTRVITVARSFWPPVLLQFQNYTRKSGIALPKRPDMKRERNEMKMFVFDRTKGKAWERRYIRRKIYTQRKYLRFRCWTDKIEEFDVRTCLIPLVTGWRGNVEWGMRRKWVSWTLFTSSCSRKQRACHPRVSFIFSFIYFVLIGIFYPFFFLQPRFSNISLF